MESMDYPTPDVVYLTSDTSVVQSCSRVQRGTNTMPKPSLVEIQDLKMQQALVMKDLLFVLLGYEGFFIRPSEKYNPDDIDMRIAGPEFKTAKHLDISLKSVTKKLVRFGKFYVSLVAFMDHYDDPRYGKVIQRLCMQVSEFIEFYHHIIVDIESQFTYNANFTLNIVENTLNQEIANKMGHLYEICTAVHEVTIERRAQAAATQQEDQQFTQFITRVRESLVYTGKVDTNVASTSFPCCKGGLVLRIVQQRINTYKGDAASLQFLSHVLVAISVDYVEMLNNWLITGSIDDPFDEFLIQEKQVPTPLSDFFDAQSERYWGELFVVRSDGVIDQLASTDIQQKILNTGKYLTVFKRCTGLHNFHDVDANDVVPIDSIALEDLELKIDMLYHRANLLLLRLVFDGYHMRQLVEEFQNRFMFKQCAAIDRFLDQSFHDLKKNKTSVSVSSLRSHYDHQFAREAPSPGTPTWDHPAVSVADIVTRNQRFSLSDSNVYETTREVLDVQAFDPEQVLGDDSPATFENFMQFTLEKRTAPPRASSSVTHYDKHHLDDYAIASVDLAIPVPFPLNLVINRELRYHYELMFKVLMVIRWLQRYNEQSWQELHHSTVWRHRDFVHEVRSVIKRCRVLNSTVGIFLSELMTYLHCDVIDANYTKLMATLDTIQSRAKTEAVPAQASSPLTTSFGHSGSPLKQLGNYKTTNSIFDNLIHQNKHQAAKNTRSEATTPTVDNLGAALAEYLTAVVNDSFIAKGPFLTILKALFDTINAINQYFSSLKRKLIMCNPTLFAEFCENYPDRFDASTPVDEQSTATRYKKINDTVTEYMAQFNDTLNDFIDALKELGESETKSVLVFCERLESVFG
ncbi:hypothetical protein DICA0_E33650 [Diutina catenulata]